MKELQEDIQNRTFKPVYLLYGEEHYLRNYYRKQLCDAIVPPEDTMNRTTYTEDGFTEGEAIDQAETMPFFAERRLLLFQRTGFFKKSAEKLPEYLAEIPEYAVLVFVEDEVDKRSRMYKAVQKYGRVVEFPVQREDVLGRWVVRMLGKGGLRIRSADLRYFLTRIGDDMSALRLETDKLVHYCSGKAAVSREDIEAVTSNRPENSVFEIVSAVTGGNRPAALDLYHTLTEQKESPLGILALLSRQYSQLLVMRELLDAGVPSGEIAQRAGMHPYAVKKNIGLARSGSASQFEESLSVCVQTESDIKNGRITDALGCEMAIVELSGREHKR